MSDKKFFDKNISPRCIHCLHGSHLSGGEEIFCVKNGITEPNDSCKKYKYDPLKRVPNVRNFGRDYNSEDFKL